MDRLLTPEELAESLVLTTATLAFWRHAERGPRFVRLDNRKIRYRESDVTAWLEQRSNAPGD